MNSSKLDQLRYQCNSSNDESSCDLAGDCLKDIYEILLGEDCCSLCKLDKIMKRILDCLNEVM
jgi:hypothetical protein